MRWGLAQGLMGSTRASLAPSVAGVGPNIYLGRNDFLRMLGIALAVHVLAFGVAALFPSTKVTNIPVRALSFKLGDQDQIAAYGSAGMPSSPVAATVAAPVMQASARETVERVAPTAIKWKPVPPKPEPVVTPIAQPQPMVRPVPQPAIAPTPQQYVREVGQAKPAASPVAVANGYGAAQGAIGGVGVQSTQTEQTVEAIRERYEQQISGWIERHKSYPAEAGGREGHVIVRMRIDRTGAVRYYAIEESSGIAAIDMAAIDMIRRANPVPAVPANYPAGNLIEFLIPINFSAPR